MYTTLKNTFSITSLEYNLRIWHSNLRSKGLKTFFEKTTILFLINEEIRSLIH